MPPPIQAAAENVTEPDPYAAVAIAIVEAQRLLALARGQPVIAMIPVAEAQAQRDELRSRIVELGYVVDRHQESCRFAMEERDDAQSQLADIIGVHEREREQWAVSMEEERTALQGEYVLITAKHQYIAARNASLEAEKKQFQSDRTLMSRNLHQMVQILLRAEPQHPASTLMTATLVASRPAQASGSSSSDSPGRESEFQPAPRPPAATPIMAATSVASRPTKDLPWHCYTDTSSCSSDSKSDSDSESESESDATNPRKRKRTSNGSTLTVQPAPFLHATSGLQSTPAAAAADGKFA